MRESLEQHSARPTQQRGSKALPPLLLSWCLLLQVLESYQTETAGGGGEKRGGGGGGGRGVRVESKIKMTSQLEETEGLHKPLVTIIIKT